MYFPNAPSQVTFDFLCADRLPCTSISTACLCPHNNTSKPSINSPRPKRVHFNDEPVFQCHDTLLQGSGCQGRAISPGNETDKTGPNIRDSEEEEDNNQELQATINNNKWSRIKIGNEVNGNILDTTEHAFLLT